VDAPGIETDIGDGDVRRKGDDREDARNDPSPRRELHPSKPRGSYT
jgi:hypothetical protein